jgi:hypothetical protein
MISSFCRLQIADWLLPEGRRAALLQIKFAVQRDSTLSGKLSRSANCSCDNTRIDDTYRIEAAKDIDNLSARFLLYSPSCIGTISS